LSAVVAAVGIYGVVARVTELRRAELGIRLALGARPGDLVRMVIRQGLRPVAVGVAGGLVGSWWTTSLLHTNEPFRSFLFQVTTHDAWTFALVPVGLLMVSLVACWIPARSTTRLDPTAVLREP
jgi:ABC-type lipoprotein release transport system permease subunit